MSKYIDAEKLIAEIERYRQEAAIARFDNAGENAEYFQGKVESCDDLTHIITSLQQEQPEADLSEHQIADIIQNLFPTDQFIESESLLLDRNEAILFARHFYELGLNARKED